MNKLKKYLTVKKLEEEQDLILKQLSKIHEKLAELCPEKYGPLSYGTIGIPGTSGTTWINTTSNTTLTTYPSTPSNTTWYSSSGGGGGGGSWTSTGSTGAGAEGGAGSGSSSFAANLPSFISSAYQSLTGRKR